LSHFIDDLLVPLLTLHMQLMKLLYPEKNYTISANILEYRPPTRMDKVRLVRMTDEAAELDRKSKFSFAIMDMLQITPATKLMFLQVRSRSSWKRNTGNSDNTYTDRYQMMRRNM
jgi:hypothetical protein